MLLIYIGMEPLLNVTSPKRAGAIGKCLFLTQYGQVGELIGFKCYYLLEMTK